MRKQTRYTLLAVALILVALAAVFYLRWNAPPEVARLLPESDGIVYVNLKPLRAATHFERTQVARSAEYQQFVDATGIEPERDLDAVAFALNRMSDPKGPNGIVGYSEVFSGRFDGDKLTRYLVGAAVGREAYAGHTIFAIPSDGRILRVVVLGYDLVAASNMPTAEQIHSMLDRGRAGASPFGGSSLLSARYGDVPAFSEAWGMGMLGLPFSEDGQISALGVRLPVTAETPFVASLRYEGMLHLRVEEITASEADAEKAVDQFASFVGVLRAFAGVEQEAPGMREVIDSIEVVRRGQRAVVTATVPVKLLKTGH